MPRAKATPPSSERIDQPTDRTLLGSLRGRFGPVEVESGSLLRTERLVLRPLRASDREAWIELVSSSRLDLDAFAPLHEPGESDDQAFERQLDLTTQGEASGTAWRRVAMLNDATLVGGFNINSIRRGLQNDGDVNWWLGLRHQRQGLATEALGALVDFAFLDMPAGLGLHRLWASIEPGNDRSTRLASRIGYIPADDGSDRMRLAGGKWSAHELYAIDAPLT